MVPEGLGGPADCGEHRASGDARSGIHGLVRIPRAPEECRRLHQESASFRRRQEEIVRELIANRTLDEEMQERIYAAIMPLIVRG